MMIEFMSQHPWWTFFAGVWAGFMVASIFALWVIGKLVGPFRLWR